MIFGRSSGQGGQNPQGPADNASQTPQGYGAPQSASPWQSSGGIPLAGSYPSQQAGTGYAGYTPGSEQSSGAGYGQGNAASPYGQSGYGQQGGYSQNAAVWPRQGQNAYGGNGYGPQTGGYPQAGNGYGAAGYPQQGQRYGMPNAAGTGGYPNAGQGYGNQNGAGYPQAGQPYAPQGPYGYGQGYAGAGYQQQAQGGYAYPQMPAGQGNYGQGQQGYPQGGYGSPYAQMGRNQQPQPDYGSQIPLNGGGYVPQPVPVKRQPFVFNDGLLIILSAVLLALLAAGLFAPSARALLWPYLALAAGSIAFFWIRPVVSGNRRMCYTIVFGALSLVALVTALGVGGGGGGRPAAQQTGQVSATPTPGMNNAVVDTQTGNSVAAVSQSQSTETPTPAADTSAADRLETFFRYWAANMQDEMLTLCAPSWQSSVDNPKTALFGLLANRKPIDYTVEGISGTDDSTSRKVTVTSTIDRNNGKAPVKYRLSVLMLKEGDQWFVDPQSLKTYEEAETPDPATLPTPTATAPPAANANTILYYNPDGGSKYHLDQNCKSTHAKYLPMKGHFKYSEINDDKYKNLSPCNVCAAPLRP